MAKLGNTHITTIKKAIWIFYATGLLGIGIPWSREFFITLLPLSYLFSLMVLLIMDKSDLKKLIPFFVIVFCAIFFIEVLGVKTGKLFGEFEFGDSLGPKLWETPIIIGVNWLILLYCATIIASGYTKNRYFISFLVAVLMVVFDFILERPAGYLDMWEWTRKFIPMQNFLVWFGISWILAGALQLLKPKMENKIAATLFGIQMLLFFLLNIVFYFENSWS